MSHMLLTAFEAEHRHCRALFLYAERLASSGQWDEAQRALEEFVRALDKHLSAEEEMLFPALEAWYGGPVLPVQAMRREHAEMRALLRELRGAARARDADEFDGLAETLLIFMEQHDAREERVLYPMSERMLADTTRDPDSVRGTSDGR
ncbi:MAG TPA: hemerythrin domain-containing protein [Burkholderiales bacterium]|nr:hemerythrin domain-containing protein [Burkholderiales bacterium]